MKIKELEKKYPYKKYEWYAYKDGHVSFYYNDNDEVVSYEIKEKAKSVDITNVVFGKGKAKVEYKTRIIVHWKRSK